MPSPAPDPQCCQSGQRREAGEVLWVGDMDVDMSQSQGDSQDSQASQSTTFEMVVVEGFFRPLNGDGREIRCTLRFPMEFVQHLQAASSICLPADTGSGPKAQA